MFKILRKLLFLILIYLSILHSQTQHLMFKIEVTKDTIYVGEPIVIKCMLVNNGTQEVKIWSAEYGGLLNYGYLDFILYVPQGLREYHYGVFRHINTIGASPDFVLHPHDSVYFYSILCWAGGYGGFLYQENLEYDYLTYDELNAGLYKIKSKYLLPEMQLLSNVDSFYGANMPPNERIIFDKTGSLIDEFFGWPHNIGRDGFQKIIELFPQYAKEDTSVITQFCHYVLAYCVPSHNQVGPNRVGTCEAFLRKFHDTPLAEQIEFWKAKAFEEIGQKHRAKEKLQQVQIKYPDNIQGYLYRNATQKKPIPISIGLTITENVHVRVTPDTSSEIVTMLDFGEPFLIFERKPFMEGNREWHWYRVMLTDRETKGWIISKEGREGSLKLVDLENDDYAGLYFGVATRELWGYHEYDAAERLFLYVLNTYGNRKIPVSEPLLGDVQYVYANMEALEKLALLHCQKKEFQKALQYYEQRLAQEEATKEDTISTKYGMMRLYLEALWENEQLDEALTFYHHIIRDFRDAKLIGYEGHVWLDIEAAERIVSVLSAGTFKDTSRLQKECEKIVEETTNPVVILIATRGTIFAHIHNDDYESAKSLFLHIIEHYPKEIRFYFKSHENYTASLIVEFLYISYKKDKDYDKLKELANLIEESTSGNYRISINEKHDWLILEYEIESDGQEKEVYKYCYKYSLWHGGRLSGECERIR